MEKEKFCIEMTEDEMIKFYTNKMLEENIRTVSNTNKSTYYTSEGREIIRSSKPINLNRHIDCNVELIKYADKILEGLYRDERIADVTIDAKLCLNVDFYTNFLS